MQASCIGAWVYGRTSKFAGFQLLRCAQQLRTLPHSPRTASTKKRMLVCSPLLAGADSQSGVPDQPFGDEQTLLGAYNRLASVASLPQHSSSLLCAIEGGIGWAAPAPALTAAQTAAPVQLGQQQGSLPASQQQQWEQQREQQRQQRSLECFAWVVVQAPGGRCSHARSASFLLPQAVSDLILDEGLELGAADDRVFGRWSG